jgi:hypothetical protein
MLQGNNIAVIHGSHDLQLPILVALVLQNLLNGNSLTSLQTFCLNAHADNTIRVTKKNLREGL